MSETTIGRLRTLLDRTAGDATSVLTTELRELYDGDLHWVQRRSAGADASAGAGAGAGAGRSSSSPHVIANFVTSLDGVVSYKLPGRSGGAAISGNDTTDHFVMGLLRASADAVMIGAGTLHDAPPAGLWTAEYICPSAASLYRSYRRGLGRSGPPLTVIVSASGLLDLQRAVFHTPGVRTLVITTATGRDRLAGAGIEALDLVELQVVEGPGGRIEAQAILDRLREHGVHLLLHEGGPTLFGDFLAAGAVDELFLTVAAQAVGRTGQTRRPGLVQGMEFLPEGAPWFSLLSVKQQADQLYLRYRCSGPRAAPAPMVERRDRPTRDPPLRG